MSRGSLIDTEVVFQPIVDLVNGNVLGYEALGRLHGHEKEGFAALQQAAKAHGGMARVLRRLQGQTLDRAKDRPPGTLLFINVTLGQLAPLAGLLEQTGVPPTRIVLEVPESDKRIELWESRLAEFRAAGIGVAIDDWGVGAADPMRLIHLQPEWLKIDVALIRRVGEDEAVDRLLDLLVRWVNPATTHLIAEGVEHPEQILRLRRLGIRYGQGFALARPSDRWPLTLELPIESGRRLRLRRQPLAMAQLLALSDRHLERVSLAHETLEPLFSAALQDVVAWIDAIGLERSVLRIDRRRYLHLLEHHFSQLTRGRLDESDVSRSLKIARIHQQQGIDLSYYVIGYQRFQAEVMRILRGQKHGALAETLRALFSWDMSMVMQAYQLLLDRDALTGVLTRRAFWDEITRQIPTALGKNEMWVFALFELSGVTTLKNRWGHMVGDKILSQVGVVLQGWMTAQCLVGRLGGEEFGLWMPHRDGRSIAHEVEQVTLALNAVRPDMGVVAGAAILGKDGTTAEALFAKADRRLAQGRRHLATDNRRTGA